MAVDTGIERPPKKKKLQEHQDWDMASEGASTHKNGIHIMFWKKALTYRTVVVSTQPMQRLLDTHDRLLAKAVLQQREADISGPDEHDGGREPDLETVHVEAVDWELPAQDDVVHDTDGDRCGNTIWVRPALGFRKGTRRLALNRYSQYENMYASMENL